MMKKLLALAFTFYATFAVADGVNRAVRIAPGPGVTGDRFVGPGATGTVFIGQGSSTDPAFTGSLTLTPTPLSLTQGLNIVQSGPASGSVAGPVSFNLLTGSYGSTTTGGTGPFSDHGYWQNSVSLFRSTLTINSAAGAGAGALGGTIAPIIGHVIVSAAQNTINDFVGMGGIGYATAANSGNGGLYGGGAAAVCDAGCSFLNVIGFEIDMGIVNGGVVRSVRAGLNIGNQGTGQGTLIDTAIILTSLNAGGSFRKFVTFNDLTLDPTADFFYASGAYTVANIFNLPTMTVTGNILSFPGVSLSGAGSLVITANQNSTVFHSIINSNAGTSAVAAYTASNGTGTGTFGIGGTGYTGTSIVQNRAYVFGNSLTAGVVIDASGSGATNIVVFATNDTVRFTLSNPGGIFSAGVTGGDKGVGTINVAGCYVSNAACLTNGGALGSPSSAGTIPAFTLGGTIAGGGNQINNIIIGTTTPLAGSFTTLTASTSVSSPIHTASGALVFQSNGSTVAGGINTSQQWYMGPTVTLNSGVKLTVNANTVQVPVGGLTGVTMQIAGADSGLNRIVISGANVAANIINFLNSRGTIAAPTATQNGDVLGAFGAAGYGSTAYATGGGAGVTFNATQNFTDANQGTNIIFNTTPNSTAVQVQAVLIQASGGLTIGNVATDPGIGSLQINANIFAPNLPTTTAALAAAICWTVTTGQFQRDTNAGGCLVSSGQFKHAIAVLPSMLDTVMAMRPVSFLYNDDVGIRGPQVGFIAEQLATVDDRLVGFNPDGSAHSVRYMQMTAILTKAIQELKSDNDNLRWEVEQLKRKAQ